MKDEDKVAFATAFYPAADITPSEFEGFVVQLLDSIGAATDRPRS